VGKRVFQITTVYFICNMFVEECTPTLHRDLMLRKPVQILTLSPKDWISVGTIRSNIKVGLQILMRNIYRLT